MLKLIKINLRDGGTAFLNPDFIVGVTFSNFEADISMSHTIGRVGQAGFVALVTMTEFERLKPLLVENDDENSQA